MDEEKKLYFDKLNNKIELSGWYIFMLRHKKVITILEGILIILLLVGLNSYLFKDRQLKEQIADNCGYTDNEYTCVCDKSFTDKFSKSIGIVELNYTSPKMNFSILKNDE